MPIQLEASGDTLYRLEMTTSGFWRQPSLVPEDVDLAPDGRSAYFGGIADVRALFNARFHTDSGELTDLSLMGLVAA
jgi:hypothetical protein